jgi:hypothetical protein
MTIMLRNVTHTLEPGRIFWHYLDNGKELEIWKVHYNQGVRM